MDGSSHIDPRRLSAENPAVDHEFGAALVMEHGPLLGMFTANDALQALVAVLRRGVTPATDPLHAWHTATAAAIS